MYGLHLQYNCQECPKQNRVGRITCVSPWCKLIAPLKWVLVSKTNMKENRREIFYCDECQPIIGSALREVHTSYTALSSICQHRVALRSPHVLRTGAIRQLLVQIIYQQVQGQPRNNSKSPEAPQNFLKALASHQNQPECKDQKDHHDQWPLSWELRWQLKYLTFPRVHGSKCQVGLCAPLGWVKTY